MQQRASSTHRNEAAAESTNAAMRQRSGKPHRQHTRVKKVPHVARPHTLTASSGSDGLADSAGLAASDGLGASDGLTPSDGLRGGTGLPSGRSVLTVVAVAPVSLCSMSCMRSYVPHGTTHAN